MLKIRMFLQKRTSCVIFAKPFTLIEIMMMTLILTILASILLPSLSKARRKAKFTRWYAYNAQWSRDADCVLNYTLQEGSGNILNNTAVGCDGMLASSKGATASKYDAKKYNGELRHKDNLPNEAQATSGAKLNQFKWMSTASNSGRWGAYKKALQFNGTNTYVLVPGTDALDFRKEDAFTIYTSIRLATQNKTISKGRTIYSKTRFGAKGTVGVQYDIYSNPAGANDEASFDFDTFDLCKQVESKDSYNLRETWLQVALVYTPPTTVGTKGSTKIFVNGKMATFLTTTNYEASESVGDKLYCPEPFILGACWTSQYATAEPSYKFYSNSFFEGQMDEFVMIKKALSDDAVRGMSKMGTDE